jgi:hypothetical protein
VRVAGHVYITSTPGTSSLAMEIYSNSKPIAAAQTGDNPPIETRLMLDARIAVQKGDVVMVGIYGVGGEVFTYDNHSAAYYMPVRFVETTGKVTAADVGYSYAEQDTGTTWVDGKPIYRRVLSGVITAGASEFVSTNNLGTGVDAVVSYGGYWCDGNGFKISINGSGSSTTSVITNLLYVTAIGSLNMETVTTTTRTNAPYSIWVEYTKTTV